MVTDAWHRHIYDDWYTSATIDSADFHKLAEHEVAFFVKVLKLREGAAILDVPCGAGRHTALLARRGFRMTGVDISETCLQKAMGHCRDFPVELRQGDMADLSAFRGQFDAVLNLFTSFGYFSTDAKNARVMHELVAALKPGGRLVLHLVNRDWFLRTAEPVKWRDENGTFLMEGYQFDKKTNYNEVQTVFIDERTDSARRYHYRLRLYEKNEVVALMQNSGLERIKVYGDCSGNRFRKYESSHPLFIGRKPL